MCWGISGASARTEQSGTARSERDERTEDARSRPPLSLSYFLGPSPFHLVTDSTSADESLACCPPTRHLRPTLVLWLEARPGMRIASAFLEPGQ